MHYFYHPNLYVNQSMYHCPMYRTFPYPQWSPPLPVNEFRHNNHPLKDAGSTPFVINIEEATEKNNTYRTALWTGSHLQLTLMSLDVGEDIGLEIHPHTEQFLRIVKGEGLVQMGDRKNHLNFQRNVTDDDIIIVPAGKWHNLINTGSKPLKLYSIYAPPEHPKGTVHETKAIAEAEEGLYR